MYKTEDVVGLQQLKERQAFSMPAALEYRQA